MRIRWQDVERRQGHARQSQEEVDAEDQATEVADKTTSAPTPRPINNQPQQLTDAPTGNLPRARLKLRKKRSVRDDATKVW